MFGQGEVEEKSIGTAWESLVKECWTDGRTFETEYGEKSKDLSPGIAYVVDPLSEPKIHRAVFAWHRKDGYAREILEGNEDHRIGKDWWYTYHQRLFEWPYNNEQVAEVLLAYSLDRSEMHVSEDLHQNLHLTQKLLPGVRNRDHMLGVDSGCIAYVN